MIWLGILALFGAGYLAERSWFWRRVFDRLLFVASAFWILIYLASAHELELRVWLGPPAVLWGSYLVARWIWLGGATWISGARPPHQVGRGFLGSLWPRPSAEREE